MGIWWQRLTAFIVAMLATVALASIAHSLMVQQALIAVGAEISVPQRIGQMLRDFAGLLPTLGSVLAIALAIGLAVAALVKHRAGWLAPFAYPLAGWAAVLLALVAMRLLFGFTPLAGARTLGGMLLISLSGLVGGTVYALMARRHSPR